MSTYNFTIILLICIHLLQAWGISFHKTVKPDNECICKNATLCGPIQRKRTKVVAAYTGANENWAQYDLQRITEIILTSDVEKLDPQLVCLVHSKTVQLHTTAEVTNEIIFDSTLQEQWIRETVEKLKKFHLDGASITYGGNLPAKKHSLLTRLIDRIHSVLKAANPFYQLSFSVSWYLEPSENELYKEMSKSVDYFVVREFDMSTVVHGPPCYPGPNAPIYGIMSSLTKYFEAGISPDLLVAALPWSGYLVTCQNLSSEGRCVMGECKENPSHRICYGDAIRRFINPGLSEYRWDSISQSPYVRVGLGNLTGEIWFDDGQSLSIKTQAVSRGGYRGVAGYSVDCMAYDGTMVAQVAEMWSSFSVFQ